MFSDVACSLDADREVALVCLDLSSAFDTVNHTLLIKRLNVKFGLSGNVLDWFDTYLGSRVQVVNNNGSCSNPTVMRWGVPQGSVLGPLLFNLYISEETIVAHGATAVIYADDTQIYISIQPSKREKFLQSLEVCLDDVCYWFTSNKLICNSNKSNFMYFSSKFKPTPGSTCIKFGSTVLQQANRIRNLDVIWDSNLSMRHHMSKICVSAALALRRIGYIAEYLDTNTKARLVHAFILSKLDYCNSIFYGLPDRQLNIDFREFRILQPA